MVQNLKRLLSAFLALMMVVASVTFTFTASAADYPDISTVSSAAICEIKVNEPLDYEVGEDIVFKFQIKEKDSKGNLTSTVVTAPYLSYSAAMDDGRTLKGYVEPVDGVYTVTLAGGLLRPGFVLMTVQACNEDKEVLSVAVSYKCGAGANIEKIQSTYSMPDEYSQYGSFDAFWDETLAQLDAVDGKATIQYIYDCGDLKVDGVTYDCYELEINCPKDSYYDSINGNWCGTNHVQAYLSVPQGAEPGSLGLQLSYKGYDWVSASGSKTSMAPQSSICDPGKITLSVSPHSVPAPHNVPEGENASYLSADGLSYLPKYYSSTLKSKYGYTSSHGKKENENLSPYTTYFKYMILRDVQAVNFMKLYFGSTGVNSTVGGVDTSAFKGLWDGENIKTGGSSQGGFQAIAVAGLVPEVNEVVANVPWFADQGVTSHDSDRFKPISPRDFPYGEGLRYMDTANLAARISPDANVTMNAGLIDELVPPSTVMSIYDMMNCNVSLTFHQNKGHSTSGTVIYKQTISKTSDTTEKNHTISFESEFDSTFTSAFEAAWDKVCDRKGVSVDIYKADKNTTTDFAALASSGTADAIGVVLTGDGLTNINAKLAELYALHNDVNCKLWIIENDGSLDGEQAAITLDACMNSGDRPTENASLTLYGADGVKGQSFVLTANEPHALVPSPLFIAGRGIITDAKNITFENGLLSSTGDDGSISFSAPSASASFDAVGVGDAEAYGNIEGVGLWIYKSGKLTIKGAGAMPDYASFADAPWSGKAITEIEITDGVTSIGAYNFAEFEATVNLPKSVAAIDASAIKAGSTLVGYDNSYAKTFADANSLSFTNLGAVGVAGTDLTWHLDIDTGVLTIDGTGTTVAPGPTGYNTQSKSDWYAYYSKISKVVFGDSVTTIGKYAFTAMNSLTTVELTKNIKTINSGAFQNAQYLTTIYIKGNEPIEKTWDLSLVTSMSGSYQFDGAGKKSGFDNVILSDNLTGAIGDKFISYNSSLEEISFPEGVTSLVERALYNCTALKTITVNGANTSISENFLKTDNNTTVLTTIRGVAGSPAQTYADANGITFIPLSSAIAQGKAGENLVWNVTQEDDESYTMTITGTGSKIQSYIAESGTFETSEGYGKDHSKYDWAGYYALIDKIVIDAPVTYVCGYTFAPFNNVTTLELPTSMTTISGSSCFNDMDALSTVYTTGQTPEKGTANLTNISSISSYAFVKSAIKKIIFKENVSIGSQAFRWSKALEAIELPEGATVSGRAFSGYASTEKNKVTSISYPSDMATVKYSLFTISDAANGPFIANPFVTTITIKNKTAAFEGATEQAPYTAFLDNFTALATVYGYKDSSAEAFVKWANTYFEENSIDRELTFVALDNEDASVVVKDMPIGDDLYFRILLNDDGVTYTMEIYGEGTVLTVYKADGTPFDESARGSYGNFSGNGAYLNTNYAIYAEKVSKLHFNTPNLNKFWGYSFRQFGASVGSVEVEMHQNITSIKDSSVFNGAKYVDTFYSTGSIPVKGVGDFSNFTSLGQYTFVDSKFKEIIIGDGFTSIPYYCFGAQKTGVSALEVLRIPASVTSIKGDAFKNSEKLVYIDYRSESALTGFSNIPAYATVIGKPGTGAQTFASTNGLQFIDSTPLSEIIAYYKKDNSVIIIGKVDASNYTAYCTGSATYFNMGYTDYSTAVTATARLWDAEKSLITKAVYVNPNFTKIDSSFAEHTNLKTVEIPASVTTITESCFNGSGLTTLYITGNEMVENVVDLSNITNIGSMAMASCQAEYIYLSDDLTGTWANNMFLKCSKLKYMRIPVGVTGASGSAGDDDPFNSNTVALTTVLIENPDFVFTAGIFTDSTNLSTIIGYKGSTAETFALNKGLTFVPIDDSGVLTFKGFQIRETSYNGLRSIYSASLSQIDALASKGFSVVEFGSILASSDKLNDNGHSLIVWEDENGNIVTHSYARNVSVYKNGEIVSDYISMDEAAVEYAYTVTNFDASNYNKEVTSRGYIVFADAEGNKYIVYADLLDSDGSNVDENGKSYNNMSLEILCQRMVESGKDLSANICWLDILKFKEAAAK